MQYLHIVYKNNRKYPKNTYLKNFNQLSIPSSLGVSIDYGHVPIFPNPNLQYLHHLQWMLRWLLKQICLYYYNVILPIYHNKFIIIPHSYDILGAGLLWKPKDLHKIRQNLLKFTLEECYDKVLNEEF